MWSAVVLHFAHSLRYADAFFEQGYDDLTYLKVRVGVRANPYPSPLPLPLPLQGAGRGGAAPRRHQRGHEAWARGPVPRTLTL